MHHFRHHFYSNMPLSNSHHVIRIRLHSSYALCYSARLSQRNLVGAGIGDNCRIDSSVGSDMSSECHYCQSYDESNLVRSSTWIDS